MKETQTNLREGASTRTVCQAREQSANNSKRWDSEYSIGSWDYLRSVEEVAHYGASIGFLLYTHTNGRVLDVGCGEGLLLNYLRVCGYDTYLGLDISKVAIHKNTSKVDEKTHFLAVDVELFTPIGTFDSILFSECLYYFLDPLEVVGRYLLSLKHGGVFIVSHFLDETDPLRPEILEHLARKYVCMESVKLSNGRGHWKCCLFAKETIESAERSNSWRQIIS